MSSDELRTSEPKVGRIGRAYQPRQRGSKDVSQGTARRSRGEEEMNDVARTSKTKDEILESFRASITPIGRQPPFECPVEEVKVPLRWLAIATAELSARAAPETRAVNPCRNVCSLVSLDDDNWQCNECQAVFRFVGNAQKANQPHKLTCPALHGAACGCGAMSENV